MTIKVLNYTRTAYARAVRVGSIEITVIASLCHRFCVCVYALSFQDAKVQNFKAKCKFFLIILLSFFAKRIMRKFKENYACKLIEFSLQTIRM